MTLVEQLTNLRRDLPGCRSVIFGDMATGTVLRALAGDDLRQEDHDRLLADAIHCLGPEAQRALSAAFDLGEAQSAPSEVLLLAKGGTKLFLHPREAETDALCATMDGHPQYQKIAKALQHGVADDE